MKALCITLEATEDAPPTCVSTSEVRIDNRKSLILYSYTLITFGIHSANTEIYCLSLARKSIGKVIKPVKV